MTVRLEYIGQVVIIVRKNHLFIVPMAAQLRVEYEPHGVSDIGY